MFEFIRSRSRLIMMILAPLIIGSFVLVSGQVRQSKNEGASRTVASVGGIDITQAEWDAAHRASLDRFREQVPGLDLKFFDTPAARQQALDELVRERVMLVAASKAKLEVSDERLLRAYQTDPQFASYRLPNGAIDRAKLDFALEQSHMSAAQLDAKLREHIASQQVMSSLQGTVFAPMASASAALDAMFQQREVQVERFDAKAYLAKVSPSAADIEAYYKNPAHRAEFELPELVDIEYAVLDMDTVKKSLQVNEGDLRKYYEQNAKRYAVPEERRVKHILIKPESDAKRDAAKAKAASLLAQLKKTPASFADLARANSQDVGTAANGGEVDVAIARGDVAEKAYEEALFALKPGQLSEVIDTAEGFYIVGLNSVRVGSTRSFEAARSEIEDTVRQSMAQVKFSEAVEEFTNLVYEQPDSLKPALDKFKLQVRTAQGLKRGVDAKAEGPLASAKFVEALFAPEALVNKRNTQAQQIKPTQWAAARVVKHTPSSLKPLADVSAAVKEKVTAQQAAALASKEGAARLAVLQATPATALAGASVVVSRGQSRELPRELVDAVLKATSVSLPAVVGVDLGAEGYALAKVSKVLGRDPIAADAKQGQNQVAQAWASAEAQAYYAALKSRFKVEMKPIAETKDAEAASQK
jgi:peptidyl-prolyl cis-trans isomerase D